MDRCGDRHRIDPGILKKVAKISCRFDIRMEALTGGQLRRIQIANTNNARRIAARKIADEVRTPVPVTHHSNAYQSIRHLKHHTVKLNIKKPFRQILSPEN